MKGKLSLEEIDIFWWRNSNVLFIYLFQESLLLRVFLPLRDLLLRILTAIYYVYNFNKCVLCVQPFKEKIFVIILFSPNDVVK